MSWEPYDPCPDCGAQNEDTFRQVTRQTEDVVIDENGEPESFDPLSGSLETVAIACTECDTIIVGEESDFDY